ncbi:4695_t:CDS:2 [Acaulospora morrowiae]|uniref:4695_t:CDS:1 n=1 Tax=Acaulospora morrowiae TaxID=94023 RepID=A0A9N8Z5U7_9GLOM|nr:4695_t:CDS:2 [Acaulospora morrowiae]
MQSSPVLAKPFTEPFAKNSVKIIVPTIQSKLPDTYSCICVMSPWNIVLMRLKWFFRGSCDLLDASEIPTQSNLVFTPENLGNKFQVLSMNRWIEQVVLSMKSFKIVFLSVILVFFAISLSPVRGQTTTTTTSSTTQITDTSTTTTTPVVTTTTPTTTTTTTNVSASISQTVTTATASTTSTKTANPSSTTSTNAAPTIHIQGFGAAMAGVAAVAVALM